jgi:hypothetical protein
MDGSPLWLVLNGQVDRQLNFILNYAVVTPILFANGQIYYPQKHEDEKLIIPDDFLFISPGVPQ